MSLAEDKIKDWPQKDAKLFTKDVIKNQSKEKIKNIIDHFNGLSLAFKTDLANLAPNEQIEQRVLFSNLINQSFWVPYGVNFIYVKKLDDDLAKINRIRKAARSDVIPYPLITIDNQSSLNAQTSVKPEQIINPSSLNDAQRNVFIFYNDENIGVTAIIKKILAQPKPISKNKELKEAVEAFIPLFSGFSKRFEELVKSRDAVLDGVNSTLENITLEDFIQGMRIYYLTIEPDLYKKAEEPTEPAAIDKAADAAKGVVDKVVDKVKGRIPDSGKPEPAAAVYDLKKPEKKPEIKTFQDSLNKFHSNITNSESAKLAKKITATNPTKLEDSAYGTKTHTLTRTVVTDLLAYVKAAKAAAEQKKKASNNQMESKQTRNLLELSRLINHKLNGNKKFNLFEDESSETKPTESPTVKEPTEAEKTSVATEESVNYDALIKELESLQKAFDTAYNGPYEDDKTKESHQIDQNLIIRLQRILGELQYSDGKITNLDDIAKLYVPKRVVPATPKGLEKPKEEPSKKEEKPAPSVSRLNNASCWYSFNINIAGNSACSPKAIFTGIMVFETWFNKINTVLDSQTLPAEYTFLSDRRGGYRELIQLLNDRKDQPMNLLCFIRLFSEVVMNFNTLLESAENDYTELKKESPEKAQVFLNSLLGKFLNENGTRQGTIMDEMNTILDRAVREGAPARSKKIAAAAEGAKNVGDTQAAAALGALAGGATDAQVKAAAAKAKETTSNNIVEVPTDLINNEEPIESARFRAFISNFQKQKQLNPNLKFKNSFVIKVHSGPNQYFPATVDVDGNYEFGSTISIQESLKQKRDWLLNEALFKRFIK